jgi:molybdopterin-guanine dinucleotide biosynthesis protein A
LDVSCIILAGGKSTRLGRNKVAETIGTLNLIERVISVISSFNAEIIVVAANDSSLPQLNQYQRLKLIQDIYPGRGSIGGIYSGLVASKSFYNLVVACDMPFLNFDLLQYMLNISEGYDVVVPKVDNQTFEPLHAIYSQKCKIPLEQLIKKNVFRIIELFDLVKVRYLAIEEINVFDPKHLSFFNINTEADLRSGREIVRKEGLHGD